MQQINFYLSLKKTNRYAVQFDQLMITLILLVSVLASITILQKAYLAYEKYQLENFAAKQITYTQKLQQLMTNSKKIVEIQKIKQNIENIKSLIDKQKQQLKVILEYDQKFRQYKLSDYLTQLASFNIKGTWLTEISILNQGQQISLKGDAYSSELVMQFMRELNQQPVFAAQQLHNLQLTHGADSSYISFTLTN